MTLYNLTVQWAGVDRTLSVAYVNPPTRRDVERLVGDQWRRLPTHVQDECWEFILIAGSVPTMPWVGAIQSIYGTIQCTEREAIENEPHD